MSSVFAAFKGSAAAARKSSMAGSGTRLMKVSYKIIEAQYTDALLHAVRNGSGSGGSLLRQVRGAAGVGRGGIRASFVRAIGERNIQRHQTAHGRYSLL